ncbi:MAG TPA: PAS domain-containing sensor histidine kinase [Acidimicrobiales bacterium]|nr:PAS domain-containing sensor histidine kinase [Acidimicrobiales bacterium]
MTEAQSLAGRMLSALTSVVLVGVVATDPDGVVWYCNKRWEDVSGVPIAEQVGGHWWDTAHPDDRAELAGQWKAQTERRGQLGPFRTRPSPGTELRCVAESTAVQDARGAVVAYCVTVTDADVDQAPFLTGPHAVQRIMDRTEDVVTILNPDGTWRWSSAGALRLIGKGMDYQASEGVYPYVHPDDAPMVAETFDRLVNRGGDTRERVEVRIRAADGSWRDMEVVVDVLLDDPAIRGVVLYARDVTERRAMLEELAKIDTYKTAAMATVSHELRNPLTSITGFAELLRDSLDPDRDREQIGYVDTILRSARQVMRLSGDLVDLESLATGSVALSPAPLDLADCLRQVATAAELEATRRGLQLEVDVADGPELVGDADRLAQLVDNLLSNAVKFTAAGGRVVLRGWPVDDGWRIEVADTGMGIPADEVPKLFTQFFRASNARTDGIDGRGLGLSIAKAIVDLHHGEIEVDSVMGSGTTFRVLLRGADPAS